MNRRVALSALGGAALAARGFSQTTPQSSAAAPQRVTPAVAAERSKAGVRPQLCLYSGCLAKIPYSQLAEIVGSLGYDGVDLTVMKGGHVDPSLYMVHLDRAFQTFQDAGLDVPMVTTDFTSASQTYAYAIFYVSGELGARFCKLGTWPPEPGMAAANASPQLANIRATVLHNDLAQFATTGLHCHIVPLLANHAGSYPGRSVPEVEALLNGVEPKAFGYCFDAAQAVVEARSADGWIAALQAALPRLAAISLADVALDRDPDGSVKPRFCPLGEGVIDWKKFFPMLSAAHFHGPASLRADYGTNGNISALKKDLAFARARVEEAWPL